MRIQRHNFGKDNVFGYQLHEEKYNFHQHIHQFVELTLVLEGELQITVGDREAERAGAGDFILIFPFQTHKYSSDRVNRFVIYTFSPSLIADFIENAKGKIGERSVFSANKSTFDLFTSRLLDEKDFSIYSIRSCLYAMLSDFSAKVDLCDSKADGSAIEKLVKYVNENYTDTIPLEVVAREIGYSGNYLSHCIKKSFSFGYPTLLACVRVENAKKLLLETKLSSLEIALECGFGSERSFNRQFKHITGMTPKSYKTSTKMTVVDKKKTLNWEYSSNAVFSAPIEEDS